MLSALGHDKRATAGTALSDILAGKGWNTFSACLERAVFTDRGGMRKWLRATSLDQESTLPQQARRHLFTVHVAAQVKLPPGLLIQRGDSVLFEGFKLAVWNFALRGCLPDVCVIDAFKRERERLFSMPVRHIVECALV